MIRDEIEKLDIDCALVHGGTAEHERSEALSRFNSGVLPVLINVTVLTTGWDSPRLSCIALLRPTRSLPLYLQIIGRGLRLHESKQDTLVLDYGGNLERFGPIDKAAPVERKKVNRVQVCDNSHSVVSVFVFDCPDCGHHFKDKPKKVCMKCGANCMPSAAVCDSCGDVFTNHISHSVYGAILSVENDIR